ncbi:Alpha/Beta hydrolase protein [Boletus reticuloceps]|uniref:Alpha/Beta hydrolase protein n=1 Tax=Boletus reticuloceps TaxID=495285 RepID=A0A8I2YTP8_9AGAM|nr:Alpha/Beta hydrolase protein [Boletus reticuloceps]
MSWKSTTMTVDRTSTKLHIPHPSGCFTLVGVLEQLEPHQPTNGRNIALMSMSFRFVDISLRHKDYLFQKRLALRLPFDSFRFDFRGNHESGGQWRQGGFVDDVEDLVVVVAYLRSIYGYKVDMVVGHSRGSVVGMHWLCTAEEGKRVRALINVSGRYRMHMFTTYRRYRSLWEEFETKGYYDWNVVVARKAVVQKIYPHDLEECSRWNSDIVWDNFPSSIDVLTIHGLADRTVPVYDAIIYARIFGARTPGTHNLHLIEEADHNLTGRQDEVVDCILEWWEAKRSGSLTTGIFRTGLRGKL